MDDILDASDLADAPTDMLDFVRWLSQQLGRRPGYGDVIRARAQVARSLGQQASTKAPRQPRQKARKEEQPGGHVHGIMSSFELWLAISAALALFQASTSLAWFGRGLQTKPRRSAEQALEEHRTQIREIRRFERERRYGDADYPRALRALLRTSGSPKLPIKGRSPWEIVRQCRPEVAAILRQTRDDEWAILRRRVRPETTGSELQDIIKPSTPSPIPPVPTPADGKPGPGPGPKPKLGDKPKKGSTKP